MLYVAAFCILALCLIIWMAWDRTRIKARLDDLENAHDSRNGPSDFYKKISNLTAFPLWVYDENMKLIWANQAYVDAVDAQSLTQVISEELRLAGSMAGRELAENDHGREKHFIVIEGQRRAVEIYKIPLEIEGPHRGSLCYALDITDLEKARGELIYHTESHGETLNKLSTAVAIFTSGKQLEYYNIAFGRLWQLSEEFLLSHPHHGEVLEAMREDRRLPEQANFPKWKAEQLDAYTRILEPVEEMWHLPDNSSLRVVTQPHPLGGLLVFYEDVTDHFALERSYNTLFAVQNETLNNLHEGLAVFGIDGCLQLYNEAFIHMWQLSRDMLDKSPHATDVMAACAKNFGDNSRISQLQNLILGGEEKKEISSGQLKRQDDTVLDYAAVPLPDGAMLITFIDVSDSFKVEKILRERNLALEETDKIKTDFLAHMSYELRTPLNSIIGFSELLDKEYHGPLNDIQHGYMQDILSASGQLRELINDILDLSVIEAGGMTLDIAVFDLLPVMEQVADQLQKRLSSNKIELVRQFPHGLKPVQGDARRIQHTVNNLLSNAVKFTPEQGIITLSISQDNFNYRIIVEDSGCGIKSHEINKVFEKFYTGEGVSPGQGAGLGLSLVKSFVELHGGKVEIQSSENVGTRVTLTFPLKMGMDAQINLTDE